MSTTDSAAEPDRGVVLVLRALGLGDALTGIPALRGLRRAFPHRRLILAAPPGIGSWLRDLGLVDDVVPASAHLDPLPVAGNGVDLIAVNLHGRGPHSHRRLMALSPVTLIAFANQDAGFATGPVWRPAEHEVDRWCRLVRGAGAACGREDLRLAPISTTIHPSSPAGAVVLHPGASTASRRWPLDRWIKVAGELAKAGYQIVISGGSDERHLTGSIAAATTAPPWAAPNTVHDLGGQLSLHELTALIAGARLLICGDTGVAHLATAVGTPSVLLFGPCAPSSWGPVIDPDLHTVIWHGIPGHAGEPQGTDTDPALDKITPEDVLAAAIRHLGTGTT